MKEFAFLVVGAILGGIFVSRSAERNMLKKENERLKEKLKDKDKE